MGTSHAPGDHAFLGIKFVLAILVEGHSVIISTKLFLIQRRFLNLYYRDKPCPLIAIFFDESKDL